MPKSLNGWQRLWVVLTVLWTITVGLVTWNAWPETYLSLDPNAGIPLPPVGSDVTLLTEGVIKANETLTVSQFASRLKARYPEYADLGNDALVTRTLERYPHFRPFIIPDSFVPDTPDDVIRMNRENRIRASRTALMLWLLPPLGLYVFGYASAWVYRGFRTP